MSGGVIIVAKIKQEKYIIFLNLVKVVTGNLNKKKLRNRQKFIVIFNVYNK